MYWYNPVIKKIETTKNPTSDAAARRMLSGREGAVTQYEEWRKTQKRIVEAMIFTGQHFQLIDSGHEPPR